MRRKMEKLAEKLNGNVMYLTENPFGVDIGFYDDCKYFLCWQNTHRVFKAFETQKDPEQLLIDKENVLLLERKIEEELSAFEKQVLDLYLTGMSYTQIARVLGRDEKSTDNTLQHLKSKIRKVIAR